MNHYKKLIDFLLKDYSRNRLSFSHGAWVALLGHSFYGILWTYVYSQPHEDIKLRIICASLFSPFIFIKYLHFCCLLSITFFQVAFGYLCNILLTESQELSRPKFNPPTSANETSIIMFSPPYNIIYQVFFKYKHV